MTAKRKNKLPQTGLSSLRSQGHKVYGFHCHIQA